MDAVLTLTQIENDSKQNTEYTHVIMKNQLVCDYNTKLIKILILQKPGRIKQVSLKLKLFNLI